MNLIDTKDIAPNIAKIYAKGLLKYANYCFYSVLNYHFSKVSQIFIRLVIEQRRESHLSQIAKEYQRLYRLNLDILRIKIITSASIENSFCEKIIKKILKKYMLKCQVHKEIIGGFLLYVENTCWDASVIGQISQVRRKLQAD